MTLRPSADAGSTPTLLAADPGIEDRVPEIEIDEPFIEEMAPATEYVAPRPSFGLRFESARNRQSAARLLFRSISPDRLPEMIPMIEDVLFNLGLHLAPRPEENPITTVRLERVLNSLARMMEEIEIEQEGPPTPQVIEVPPYEMPTVGLRQQRGLQGSHARESHVSSVVMIGGFVTVQTGTCVGRPTPPPFNTLPWGAHPWLATIPTSTACRIRTRP